MVGAVLALFFAFASEQLCFETANFGVELFDAMGFRRVQKIDGFTLKQSVTPSAWAAPKQPLPRPAE